MGNLDRKLWPKPSRPKWHPTLKCSSFSISVFSSPIDCLSIRSLFVAKTARTGVPTTHRNHHSCHNHTRRRVGFGRCLHLDPQRSLNLHRWMADHLLPYRFQHRSGWIQLTHLHLPLLPPACLCQHPSLDLQAQTRRRFPGLRVDFQCQYLHQQQGRRVDSQRQNLHRLPGHLVASQRQCLHRQQGQRVAGCYQRQLQRGPLVRHCPHQMFASLGLPSLPHLVHLSRAYQLRHLMSGSKGPP